MRRYHCIFQFSYGNDGFDAGWLEGVETKTRPFSSFISTKRLAGKLNTKYGYVTPGEPKLDTIVPKPHPKYKMVPNIPTPDIPKPKYTVGGSVIIDDIDHKIMMIKSDKLLVQPEDSFPRWVKMDKL